MPIPTDWVPMYWPCGPLEAALKEKEKGFDSRAKDLLARWSEPSTLAVVKDTPVNCLVVRWAAGLPQDAAQQQALSGWIRAAHAAGLTVVGVVAAAAEKGKAVAAAEAAGFAALAVEGDAPRSSLPIIPLAEEGKAQWRSASPLLVLDGMRWPGITMGSTRESEDVNAGATQAPWIDSNAYVLQMAAALAGSDKTFWLMFHPPAKERMTVRDSYLRAVADAGMAGGRWVLSLDDDLRGGLLQGRADALATWKATAAASAFFARHSEWRSTAAAGLVGIVSDFSGPNELLGTEVLNLLARRNLPFRVIAKGGPASARFAGLKAVCCLDEGRPDADLRTQCEEFASQGGLLFATRAWGVGGQPEAGFDHPRFEMRRLGKGRVAIAKEDSPDPYLVARDVHMILGRTHDLVRFYNISSLISCYTAKPNGPALLQFVNYARRAPDDVITAWLGRPYRSARLWTLGAGSAQTVAIAAENGGTAVHLPSIPVYAGVELTA